MTDSRESEAPRRLADHLREYLRDPTLWPVLIVGIAIFVTIGAAMLLASLGGRNPFALAALLLLAGVTLDVTLRELRSGGPGWACGIALSLWGLSGAAALGVVWMGWY